LAIIIAVLAGAFVIAAFMTLLWNVGPAYIFGLPTMPLFRGVATFLLASMIFGRFSSATKFGGD